MLNKKYLLTIWIFKLLIILLVYTKISSLAFSSNEPGLSCQPKEVKNNIPHEQLTSNTLDLLNDSLSPTSSTSPKIIIPSAEEILKLQQTKSINEITLKDGVIDNKSEIYKILEEIYLDLFKTSGIDSTGFTLIIADTEKINASVNLQDKIVQFNWGLLTFLKEKKILNKSTLKFILGHEIGHIVSEISTNKDSKNSKANLSLSHKPPLSEEYFADKFGLRALDHSSDSPLEGIKVLESFEDLALEEEKQGDSSNITTTHPHSHRRKMKAHYEINRQYWENLFQDNPISIDSKLLSIDRSKRFNFEKELFSDISFNNQIKMIDKATNLQQLVQSVGMLRLITAIENNLQNCKSNTVAIANEKNIDEILFASMIPIPEIYHHFRDSNDTDKEKITVATRKILTDSGIIDENGVVLRRVKKGKEQNTIYQKLLPIYSDNGYAIIKILEDQINQKSKTGNNIAEKFIEDSKIANSKIDTLCDKGALSKAIDTRIALYENKHKIKFSTKDKEKFLYQLIAKSLNSSFPSQMPKAYEAILQKKLANKFTDMSIFKRKMFLKSDYENLAALMVNSSSATTALKKIPGKLIQILKEEIVNTNLGGASILEYFNNQAKEELRWTSQLSDKFLNAFDSLNSAIRSNTETSKSPQEIIDLLAEKNGVVDWNYCQSLSDYLGLVSSTSQLDQFLAFYYSNLKIITSDNNHYLYSENFLNLLFKQDIDKKRLKIFIEKSLENDGTKKSMLSSLVNIFSKALEKKTINAEEALQLLEQIISKNKLNNYDSDILKTLENILQSVKDIDERLSLFSKCKTCTSYSFSLSNLLCYHNLEKCIDAGAWFDANLLEPLKSKEEKENIFKKVLSKKAQYSSRLTPYQLNEFFSVLNWKTFYNENLNITENKEFLGYLVASDFNRQLFYSKTRKGNRYSFARYKKTLPMAFSDLSASKEKEITQTTLSKKVKDSKCDNLLKFSKSLYEITRDEKSDNRETNPLLSFTEIHRLSSAKSFWENFNENKYEPLVRTFKLCLLEDGIKFSDLSNANIPLVNKFTTLLKVFEHPTHQRNSLIVKALNADPLTCNPLIFEQKISITNNSSVSTSSPSSASSSIKIFDLLQNGPLKEIIAKRILLSKEFSKDLNFKKYSDVKETLDYYLPTSSPIKKELFSKFLQNIPISVAELTEYQTNEQKDLEEDARSDKNKSAFHETIERVSDLIENLNADEKE
ncbi:MAG: M48 family metalloprotease, partial [Oligoflexia bacterium]|nr:M48 family metalloprotease [Oligoflexia bacterium]